MEESLFETLPGSSLLIMPSTISQILKESSLTEDCVKSVMGLSRILSAPEIAFYRGLVFSANYCKKIQPVMECFDNIFHFSDFDESEAMTSILNGPSGYSSSRGPNPYPKAEKLNTTKFIPNLVVHGSTPTNEEEFKRLLNKVHARYYELGQAYGWYSNEPMSDDFFINGMMGYDAEAPVDPTKYTFSITAKKNNVFVLSMLPLTEDRSDAIQILDSYENAIRELRKYYDLGAVAKTRIFSEYSTRSSHVR